MSQPVRRPPPSNRLKYLRMAKPFNHSGVNTCAVLMQELFTCWAGTSLNSPECAMLESRMKKCYDTQVCYPAANSIT